MTPSLSSDSSVTGGTHSWAWIDETWDEVEDSWGRGAEKIREEGPERGSERSALELAIEASVGGAELGEAERDKRRTIATGRCEV